MYVRNKVLTITEHQVLVQMAPAFVTTVNLVADASQWIDQEQDPLSAVNVFTCLDPSIMAGKQCKDVEASIA